MKYTTNYNLKKPDLTDPVSIGDLNDNSDIIDAQLSEMAQDVADNNIQSNIQDKLGLIGWNNLIRNSGFNCGKDNLDSWEDLLATGATVGATDGSAIYGENNYLYIVKSAGSSAYIYQTNIRFKPNTKYIMIFKYYNNMSGGDSGGKVYVMGQNDLTKTTTYDYVHASKELAVNSGWEKVTFEFTTASDEIQCCIRVDNRGSDTGAFRIAEPMLIEGNNPNFAWSPNFKEALIQEDWITPTLLNGWTNYGGTRNTVGFMKDSMGFVHLKGSLKGGTIGSSGDRFFTLPSGYIPPGLIIAVQHTNAANDPADIAKVLITETGYVYAGCGSNVEISIDNISFYVG